MKYIYVLLLLIALKALADQKNYDGAAGVIAKIMKYFDTEWEAQK